LGFAFSLSGNEKCSSPLLPSPLQSGEALLVVGREGENVMAQTIIGFGYFFE
jgi:hypothetical protein